MLKRNRELHEKGEIQRKEEAKKKKKRENKESVKTTKTQKANKNYSIFSHFFIKSTFIEIWNFWKTFW